jgi:hypothetical protein
MSAWDDMNTEEAKRQRVLDNFRVAGAPIPTDPSMLDTIVSQTPNYGIKSLADLTPYERQQRLQQNFGAKIPENLASGYDAAPDMTDQQAQEFRARLNPAVGSESQAPLFQPGDPALQPPPTNTVGSPGATKYVHGITTTQKTKDSAPAAPSAMSTLQGQLDARDLESLNRQRSGIDTLRQRLSGIDKTALPVNLTGLAALTDAWTGSHFTDSYRPQETKSSRTAERQRLEDAIAKAENNYSENDITALRTKLNNQFQLDNLSATERQRKEQNAIEWGKINALSDKPGKNKGLETVDSKVGDDYNDFIIKGGYANATKSLGQISSAVSALGNEKDLTGTSLMKLTPAEQISKVNARSGELQSQVRDSVQDAIKQIYGASVSKTEGDRILNQAWNKDLPQEANMRNLQRIQTKMQAQLEAKKKAYDYFQNNGWSMNGYKGTLPNINDLRVADFPSVGASSHPVDQMSDEEVKAAWSKKYGNK